MKTNNRRFDLSPYLIHFFRKVDLESADIGVTPENWGPHAIVEGTQLTPMFLLRNAIRLESLWATWSVRNDRRTIYGPHPAVCFTDMPVSALIEAGEARAAKGQAMSPFALVIPKNHVRASGARPAIYGLSSNYSLPKGLNQSPRIMPASVMPELEQYRYVGLNDRVDWTHEREWRWPFRGELPEDDGIPLPDGGDMPALTLDFAGMGVIVQTTEQARQIIYDISVLHDRGAIGSYDFVLVRDEVPDLSKIREPDEVEAALTSAAIDLSSLLKISRSRSKKWVRRYREAANDVSHRKLPKHGRETGGCWLWLTDPGHKLTRSLVKEGAVQINREGRYLVEAPFSVELPLSTREELTRRLASLLKERFKLRASYHSVLDSRDPDGVPYYAAPPFEDRLTFNWADEDDE